MKKNSDIKWWVQTSLLIARAGSYSIIFIRCKKNDQRIEMSYSDRIDVIDMIISVLKEHEGSLDELVARLESFNKELVESNIAVPRARKREVEYDASMELLDYKIGELEKKVEYYRTTLRAILKHCDKIQDIACVKLIAEKTLDP